MRAALATLAVTFLTASGCSNSVDATGDEAQAQSSIVAVQVALVKRETLHGYVDAWGRVEPQPSTRSAPAASARIAALVPGLVAEVRCAEGEHVAKGAVLFQLDTRVADVAVERARRTVAYAEQVFARQETLGPGEGTSQRAYQEAEQNLAVARSELASAEAQRDLLSVRSPLGGTVTRVEVGPGDTVDLTSTLAEVVDLDRLVVAAKVRSVDITRVDVGLPVEIWSDRGGADETAPTDSATATISSQVTFVGSAVDPESDVVTVRCRVPPGSGLRPGQFVNLRILAEERRDCLTVPAASIVTRDGASEIAVVDGERAVMRPIVVGLRDGERVEIDGEGLEAGMTVVSEGAYGLPEESRIRVIGERGELGI